MNSLVVNEKECVLVKVAGTHFPVMGGRVVLGEVVTFVVLARLPKDVKLALSDTITDPVKAHVNCLGPFLFHCVIYDSFSISYYNSIK